MKRKADKITSTSNSMPKTDKKKRQLENQESTVIWPEYFHSLFKVFKAINTVLCFVSSRRQLATTFSAIRASVEGLLKQPLELIKVAEIKALLSDMVKFSYIPKNELRIHDKAQMSSGNHHRESPDFSMLPSVPNPKVYPAVSDGEHVLVLEFADGPQGKGSKNASNGAAKKLIEKRNKRFQQAVDELISATATIDDPVSLLRAAGRDHIPVNPSDASTSIGFNEADYKLQYTIPGPTERPSVNDIIAEIQEQAWYKNQIVERKTFEPREGKIGVLDPPLSETIMAALKEARGISALYTHQASAIHGIAMGKNAIVSTSTASGKSIIYQVPVLRYLEETHDATAIFIYPTKALAHDQRTAMEHLMCCCPGLEHLKVATYDGDTLQEHRAGVRESASVIFTNFDMIHISILPHEGLWRRFFKNLRLVAVDELHYYSGLLGSHAAQIMRRFRRVCAAVGNRRIRFVSCSATISNPKIHMGNIFGVPLSEIETITNDSAPSGRKDFLVWNPPPIDVLSPSLGRHSSISEATGLMRFLMKRGIRVILFCKIRKICELAMKTIRADLSNAGSYDILEKVMPYRGGYSQEDRRRIERDAFSGQLLGIVSTNALELGVDIGVLDAVIMLGFPMTIASFRQQAGRAGRRSRDSLVVFVADSFPVDQHYVENPQALFEQASDDIIVDLDSKILLEAHLQCASYEMPLSSEDAQYFGPLMKEVCENHLIKDKDGWYHTHPKFLPFPSNYVAIRGPQEEKYSIIDVTNDFQSSVGCMSIIEEVEVSRAMFEIYEGGVFIHQGLTYIVKEISHDSKLAKVVQADVNWITSPRDFTNVDAVQTYRIKEIQSSAHRIYYGKVEVEVKVFGFFKIRNKKILEAIDLDTPSWERDTTGMWIDIPNTLLVLFQTKGINPAEAIHAAQHAFLNRFPFAEDLKTECKAPEKEYKTKESKRKRPARLIFYDAIGKGGGVVSKAFDNAHNVLDKAYKAIELCECVEGCVQCVQSPACKEDNLVCSKLGALLVLKVILGLKIHNTSVPFQGDNPQEFSTIIEPPNVRSIENIQVEKAH